MHRNLIQSFYANELGSTSKFFFLLQEDIDKYKHQVYAYCLMTNHIQVAGIALQRMSPQVSLEGVRLKFSEEYGMSDLPPHACEKKVYKQIVTPLPFKLLITKIKKEPAI